MGSLFETIFILEFIVDIYDVNFSVVNLLMFRLFVFFKETGGFGFKKIEPCLGVVVK